MNKPPHLRPGDTVSFVALGSRFDPKLLKRALGFVKKWGLKPIFDPRVLKKDFLFAGSDRERLEVFRKALNDSKVKAIWCLRGGYGAVRLLPGIAKLKAPRVSKIIIGFSDVTSVQMWAGQKWNWPTLHGPLGTRLGSPLQSQREIKILKDSLFDSRFKLQVSGLKNIAAKKSVSGQVVGGCLTLIRQSLGTPFELKTENKILFFEEVGERAYALDRLLVHLKQAGKFDKVKAVIVGDLFECVDKDGIDRSHQVIKQFFKGAKFPVVTGFHAGHADRFQLSFGLGLKAKVLTKGSKSSVQFLESLTR